MDITTDQYFPDVTLTITDDHGRPASVDGVPVWGSSDDTVLSVQPATDGMSAVVMTVAPGLARITVQADADLGSGIQSITGVTEDVTVTSGNVATTMTLDLGTPTNKNQP